MKINRNNFDFVTKTDATITVLVTEIPDEIEKLEAEPNDERFLSFPVGAFIEKKDVTEKYKFFGCQVWMATYERHPDQKFTPLKAMDIAAAEHYNRISGKGVRLRKIPKVKK
jgi:hypothetical protein